MNRESARLILLSHEMENKTLMQKLLSEKLQQSVKIITPKKGEKRDLVLDVLRNAKESLVRKMAENATQLLLRDENSPFFLVYFQTEGMMKLG